MSTCHVLRCQRPAASVFTLLQDPLLEQTVCVEHKAELESGAPWMLDADSGILMGSDFPPKLVDFDISGLLSGEGGICLNMDLETPGGPKAQSIWISSAEADRLGAFLTNRVVR